MNKDEIKALISAKIAGQGNQVDSGGALDEILNAIVDAIPEGGGGGPVLKISEELAAFNTIAEFGIPPIGTEKEIKLSVEGQVLDHGYLDNVAIPGSSIAATSDGEGHLVATVPGQTATYFVHAYVVGSDSPITGVLFIRKAS